MELLPYFQKHFDIHELGDITWAHRVNDQIRLGKVLQDPSVMMLEVDVLAFIAGRIIIAHTPNFHTIFRRLSFDQLNRELKQSNKGLKIDFKDPKVVIPCLKILHEMDLGNPIILNADILSGGKRSPFDPQEFISTWRMFYPQGILSLGWKTDNKKSPYTGEEIDRMMTICGTLSNITFPIRVCFLRESWNDVQRLLENPTHSLTLWNNEPIDKELLQWIKENIDPTRAMYDLIDNHSNSIRL